VCLPWLSVPFFCILLEVSVIFSLIVSGERSEAGVRNCGAPRKRVRLCAIRVIVWVCFCRRTAERERERENKLRNRPFDSVPKGKLARLTNIIVIGKRRTWVIRLGAGAVEIPRDFVSSLAFPAPQSKEKERGKLQQGNFCATHCSR
jgi:hypothetical protein